MRRLLLVLVLLASFVLTGGAPTVPAAALPNDPIVIAVAGTSIEAFDPGWVSELQAMVGGAAIVKSWGVGGAAYAYDNAGVPRIPAHVKARFAAEGAPDVLIVGPPINDLIRSHDTLATRQAVFDLIQWAGARGTVALPATITPFRFDYYAAATLTARRNDYNGWVRSQFGYPYVNAAIDFGDVLAAGSFADPRFMADSNHPGPRGWPLLAEAAFTVLDQRGHI